MQLLTLSGYRGGCPALEGANPLDTAFIFFLRCDTPNVCPSLVLQLGGARGTIILHWLNATKSNDALAPWNTIRIQLLVGELCCCSKQRRLLRVVS